MVKTEECKWKRDKRVYVGQGLAIACSSLSFIFGVCCVVYTGRANICNTPGPGNGITTVGNYPSPLNNKKPDLLAFNEQPRNPIPECKAKCAAEYAQGPQLLEQCERCLDRCAHPWGENVDKCVEDDLCAFQHYKGIQNFCVPMAYCFSKCASKSLHACAQDGRYAVGFGVSSLFFGLLPLFVLPIVAGPQHLNWIGFAVLGFLTWLAAIIIGIDALNLNMNGKGWSWLYYKTVDATYRGRNVTPNYVPGLVLCLLMVHLILMLLAFWDPKEVWYRNQYNVRQEEYEAKLAEEKRQRDEAARIEKERVEAAAKAEEERIAREEEEDERARLDKYYYGKKTADAPADRAAPGPGSNPQPAVTDLASVKPAVNVTVGLSFAQNTDGEVVVDSVAANGPAAKTGLILKGDVVCEVGDTEAGGHPMKEVYKQDIDKWAHIVKNGAPGTSVRFILARHAEQKRFIADIVREAV